MTSELMQLKKELMKKEGFRNEYKKTMSDVFYRVGRMVKVARMKNGLSQTELASRLGTKQPAITRIEKGTGNVTLKTLKDIAVALNTKLLPIRFESMDKIEDFYDCEVQGLEKKCNETVEISTELIDTSSDNNSYHMDVITEINCGVKNY